MSETTGDEDQWITTAEAAARLGVQRSTLYSYVSRGLISSRRQPGQQQSLYNKAHVESMAQVSSRPGAEVGLLRFRQVATAVSSHTPEMLYIRGKPLNAICDGIPFSHAVRLVLGAPDAQKRNLNVTRTQSDVVGTVPVENRIPLLCTLAGVNDPGRFAQSPLDVAPIILGLLDLYVRHLQPCPADPQSAESDSSSSTDALISAFAEGLRGMASQGDSHNQFRHDLAQDLNIVCTCLLDHGLTASTTTARAAASTRASVYQCLVAGYAAISGHLHGASPILTYDMIRAIGDGTPAEVAVNDARRRLGRVPGFGHVVYNDIDPRAALGLARIDMEGLLDPLLQVMGDIGQYMPNIDLVLAGVMAKHDLPREAATVIFAFARTAGLAAHIVEEYGENPLRWRGQVPANR